ncbi:MAG: histidine kinase dimerization/phospho-acceptor domain-containing protein [Pseudomonadota bacterium]|nr:histidine kinase dimerization/phospho-acceptor domain-containing protein [Pseudomonadota bacterium]
MPTRKIKTVSDSSLRTETRLYALYRLMTAALLLFLLLLEASTRGEVGESNHFALAASIVYLVVALALAGLAHTPANPTLQIVISTILDLALVNLILYATPGLLYVVAPIWLLHVAAAGLLISPWFGLMVAIAAGTSLLVQTSHADIEADFPRQISFALIYLLIALVAGRLGRQISHSQTVTQKQRIEIAELSTLNDMIIDRLPTGVLVVNGDDQITHANKVAKELLALDDEPGRLLTLNAPQLGQRLAHWRRGETLDRRPIMFTNNDARIEPQFFQLHTGGKDALIFLENTAQAERRAETMTLATLGRFSASLAHEIRNPLSAINYAAQLLSESPQLDVMDRKMLDIVHQQVQRTNGIIESVLGLARREPTIAAPFDLGAMVRAFAEEYEAGFPLDNDTLTLRLPDKPLMALADPKQIHQILMVLLTNARYYGRMPDEPAHMTLRVAIDENRLVIDVIDRGPGIPEIAARNLFRPFYTTSNHGTGLGLYIARELARSNRGDLEYLRRVNGSCFRVALRSAAHPP